MAYELWNTDTGNIIATYSTVEEALIDVRGAIENHGAFYITSWALAYENSRGRTKVIAQGVALAQRATELART